MQKADSKVSQRTDLRVILTRPCFSDKCAQHIVHLVQVKAVLSAEHFYDLFWWDAQTGEQVLAIRPIQNIQIQIELNALIQLSGIIEVLRGKDSADTDLAFFDDRVPVLREGNITSAVDAEIQDKHSLSENGAVSFFPTARVNLVERNAYTRR